MIHIYFPDNNSQVNTFYLEQNPDVTNTMIPLAAISSVNQVGATSRGFTIATADLELNRPIEQNHFQTMTITTLPTISEDSVEIQGDSMRLATIQTPHVIPTLEESNIQQDDNFSSVPIVKRISIEQLTHRPVKFKVSIFYVLIYSSLLLMRNIIYIQSYHYSSKSFFIYF